MRFISIFLFLMIIPVLADSTVHLHFSDLSDMIESSPSGKRLFAHRDAGVAKAEAALQWSNPELEAEHEALSSDFESEAENTIVISKSFQSPWSYAAHKKALQLEIEAVELDRQQQQLNLLAEWKSMYVDLLFKQKLQNELALFQQHIQKVSNISLDRREQGTISGLENKLLQMSVFDIKATLLHLNSEIRQTKAHFKTQLGLARDAKLSLDSDITFVSVDLSSIETKRAPAASPQLARHQLGMTLAQKKVVREKGNVVPEFRLTGGYKQVNDEMKGSVIGLSIPLPVLSLNRASIQQAQAELTSSAIAYDLHKAELIDRITEARTLIEESQQLLSDYESTFHSSEVLVDLVFSFTEGWITLTDLFSGIEVYAGAIQSYYEHLSHYYENIFQLEALTSHELVQF